MNPACWHLKLSEGGRRCYSSCFKNVETKNEEGERISKMDLELLRKRVWNFKVEGEEEGDVITYILVQ